MQRRDNQSNLFQQLAKAVLFFHPAVWWLSRRLTIDREIACDDCVLSATRSPRDYALLLEDFAGGSQARQLAEAPAAWSNNSQLKERISMILDNKRTLTYRPARATAGILGAAIAAVACLGLYTGPRLALAHDPSPDAVAERLALVGREVQRAAIEAERAAADAERAALGEKDHASQDEPWNLTWELFHLLVDCGRGNPPTVPAMPSAPHFGLVSARAGGYKVT